MGKSLKVAIIPARGGSVRIPRKNIRPFYGKPIMAYSIEVARRSRLFDAIYVSTEDREIAAIAEEYGAIWINRPGALAEIDAPDCGTQEVTRHAIATLQLDGLKVDHACCIYPTAPLMTEADLVSGWFLIQKADANFALSVGGAPVRDAGQWYWSKVQPLLACAPLTLYGADTYKFLLPPDRVCDINTEEDWRRAEAMYAALHNIPTNRNQIGEPS